MPDDSSRFLALRALMMPRDTNPHGTIFGGVILSFIDQAGAVGAEHVLRHRGWPDRDLVTVAMDRVEFHQPVMVGDLLSCWTDLVRIGNTSITMHVTVEADASGDIRKVTEAEVTYVAVETSGHHRRPVPIRDEV